MRKLAKTVSIKVGGARLVLTAVLLAWPTLGVASEAIPAHTDVSTGLAGAVSSTPTAKPPLANFFGQIPSKGARQVADWVTASGDNTGLPFVVVDKIEAKVFVFDSVGRLRGATSALLGTARGDNTIPGIGSRKLSTIRPEERTTPAGRFVAALGHDLKQDILWIDYGSSISMHRVIRGNPGDHRLQRLATPSPLDKRITYGCINVPVKFYEEIVLKTFTGTNGIVYILPEIKTIQDVFSMTALETHAGQ